MNEILRRVADNLKNIEEFDPGGAVDAANDVFDALDEISGVGLRNMIKILVFDEAGNVTERQIPTIESSGGDSAKDGGVIFSGDIGDHATIHIDTGKEPSSEKQKSTSLWDRIFGSIGSIVSEAIAIILIHFLFEESIGKFAIESLIILIMLLSVTILVRHKLSKSKT